MAGKVSLRSQVAAVKALSGASFTKGLVPPGPQRDLALAHARAAVATLQWVHRHPIVLDLARRTALQRFPIDQQVLVVRSLTDRSQLPGRVHGNRHEIVQDAISLLEFLDVNADELRRRLELARAS